MFSPRVRPGAMPGLFLIGAFAVGASVLSLLGCGSGSDSTSLILGDTQNVAGSNVSAWSRVASNNTVLEVGATVPLAVFQNPPAQGTGPAGAIAVVAFPTQTKTTTYFNHFELHWEPNGHPPAFTMVPHFDLHFYSITQQEVLQVTSPDPAEPAADHVPAGYVFPPATDVVPEMGRHAHLPADYQGNFTKVNVAGIYNGRMTFLEPTINRTYLLQKTNFTLDVPRPAVLDRATRYPTKFTATYLPVTDSYQFVYSDFVSVQ